MFGNSVLVSAGLPSHDFRITHNSITAAELNWTELDRTFQKCYINHHIHFTHHKSL